MHTLLFVCELQTEIYYIIRMKRLKNEAYSYDHGMVEKRQRKSRSYQFFESLPHELILKILSHSTRKDLIALASTSQKIRRIFLPYVFAHTKVSWNHLISNWKVYSIPVLIPTPHLIETMRLTDFCSKNEWVFPFAELFLSESLPNLRSLELLTSGSTNFFKYSAAGSRLRTVNLSAVRPGSVFSLEHIKPFAQLKQLRLKDFEIEAFDEDINWCPLLDTLELENCTWCYPFQLENFGHEKITSLDLKYNNAFIISERFRLFLNNPSFTCLNHLSITNNEKNLKLTLSVHIMKLIESIPSLKTLKLNGNIYNETLHNFTTQDIDNCINYFALNNVKVFYSSFLQE